MSYIDKLNTSRLRLVLRDEINTILFERGEINEPEVVNRLISASRNVPFPAFDRDNLTKIIQNESWRAVEEIKRKRGMAYRLAEWGEELEYAE